jgi:hypothetical protein
VRIFVAAPTKLYSINHAGKLLLVSASFYRGRRRTKSWRLMSDGRLARYLRLDREVSRERLVRKLRQAVGSGAPSVFGKNLPPRR